MSEESRIHIGDLKPGDVALLRDVAESAAEKAVAKTFIAMGLDPAEPIKAQRDFSFLRDLVHDKDLEADMSWLRRSRKRSEGIVGKVITTAVGLAVLGTLHAIWEYARTLAARLPN
ncbi:MAG: hypothetical protein Q8M26_08640 [Pseudolabrys sp.]|nr:hypothetical protein [Pseudolabrys sp.]